MLTWSFSQLVPIATSQWEIGRVHSEQVISLSQDHMETNDYSQTHTLIQNQFKHLFQTKDLLAVKQQ